MSTKEKILTQLLVNGDQTVSGEALAEKAGVSRAAVWKAIEALRRDGHEINAITNSGYRLTKEADLLSAESIRLYLKRPLKIFLHKELDSTNQEAKRLALTGNPQGTVILAEHQISGRGRMGRSFYSPAGKGLYLSLILRPKLSPVDAFLITTAASVAVCRAVKQTADISAEIKWVNDVYVNNKKICGILTEAVTDFETGTIDAVILGIGVNCSKVNFPENAGENPDSLSSFSAAPISRNALAAAIIDETLFLIEQLPKRDFLTEYRQRSIVLGRNIRVITKDEENPAKALDIDDNGGLVVQYPNGKIATLNSGEISIRPI